MTVAVSVVMPVHNGEAYLRECLESLAGQTFKPFELIAVDDGSTDRTPALLQEYRRSRLRNLRIVTTEHVGIAAALKLGMAVAESELIARQDSDDLSHPTRLEQQVAYLDNHPSVAAVGTFNRPIDADGKTLPRKKRYRHNRRPCTAEGIRKRLLRLSCLTHGSVLMRGPAVELVGGYREQFRQAEDYDLWLRLSEKFDLANIPRELYSYRFHGKQAWNPLSNYCLLYTDIARELAGERRETGSDVIQRGGDSAFNDRYQRRIAAAQRTE